MLTINELRELLGKLRSITREYRERGEEMHRNPEYMRKALELEQVHALLEQREAESQYMCSECGEVYNHVCSACGY